MTGGTIQCLAVYGMSSDMYILKVFSSSYMLKSVVNSLCIHTYFSAAKRSLNEKIHRRDFLRVSNI